MPDSTMSAVLEPRRGVDWPERLAAIVIWAIAVAVASAFLWIVGDLIARGAPHLSWHFIVDAPLDAGRAGGIAPILLSTLVILAICIGVSLPLGAGTAILLAELSHETTRLIGLVRRSLDVLAGVPSIVFGLFGHAFFSVYLGLGFSVLAGGLTLACMVLPFLIRSTEEGLRAVPPEYRQAAAALGLSRWATLSRILLPAAIPGITVGLVLGIGRALAETAALLFTSGYVDRVPESLFDSGRALSVHVYDLSMNVAGGEPAAAATALVLVSLLLAINGATFHLATRWQYRRISPA